MRNLKLGFAFLCLVLAFGCADQDFIEETAPTEVTVEGQKGSIDGVPMNQPTEVVITIEFPVGFDRLQFLQTYGQQLGLIKARQCPTNSNMELWRINYITYEGLGTLLDSIFYEADPDHRWTTSNGTGADPIHPPYRTRTAPPTSSNPPQHSPLHEIIVFYEDFCNAR